MQTAIKTIFLLTLLLSTQALNLRKSNNISIQKLKKVKKNILKQNLKFGEENAFQKNIINSVLLHLQTGGKVEEVIQYIKTAIADTQSDFNNLTSEADAEYNRLEQVISGIKTDIADMNIELSATVLEINGLNTDIADYDVRIDNLQAEVAALNERESRINQARNNDVLAFAARQQRDSAAVVALGNIIPQLQALQQGSQAGTMFLERTKENIQEELKKIPLSKPIAALVQMSTAFNAAKLQSVIEKLSTIKSGIEANSVKDAQNQQESKARYESLLEELDELRSSKAQALVQAKSEKQAKQSSLALAKSKKGQLESNISASTDLMNSAIATNDQTHASYERRLGEAKAAVEGLQTVLQILQEGEENLRDRESVTDGLASQF